MSSSPKKRLTTAWNNKGWTAPIIASLAILTLLPRAGAQQPGAPQFDVASVKPGDPSSHGQMAQQSPGRYEARNLTLLSLVLGAYQINADQLIGGPSWLTSPGWDIDATFPVSTSNEQRQQMMQALLMERFGLVVHRETRTLPTYQLSVAKGGPKLKAATATVAGMSAGPRMIRYNSATMSELAKQLSSYLERQVIDKTELKGQFEIDLKFIPVDSPTSPDTADTLPTIFTALQEQLGLKLDATHGPVEVIVIDKVDKPSAN
jgi:uncharacterized protein (TIGR03435 family)